MLNCEESYRYCLIYNPTYLTTNMSSTEEMKDDEKLAIDELRKRLKNEVEPHLYDDIHLVHRFLTARDFNVDKAEDMLRKNIEWRKKHDVKNIFNFKVPEVVEKYFVYALIGFDKEGCPIRFSPVGSIDFIGIFASVKFEDLVKVMIIELESDTKILNEQSEKLKKNIEKFLYIADMKNLSFAQVIDKRSIHVLIYLVMLYLNNYPERLKAFFIINAPIYFSPIYTILRTVLPRNVMDKFNIYSNDSYKKDILKYVETDQLPAFLGGSQTDPDGNPLCLTKIRQAGKSVPEIYFMHRNKRTLSQLPGVQKVTLSRAALQNVVLDVKEPGSYLEWEFETKCRDIGFGLFFNEIVDGEKKIIELLPIQRIETDNYPETGTLKCDHPGTYVIVFDNTYSRIRGKEIYYRVKIVTPEEHDAELEQK